MLTGWDLLYATALPVALPTMVLGRLRRRRPYRQLLGRLRGTTPWSAVPPIATGRPRVWFHGVSMGEVVALSRVIEAFRGAGNYQLCLSTTTETGFSTAAARLPDVPRFYFPLDFSWAVRRALDIVEPDLVILAESELWPNLLTCCRRRRIPVALINARMSDRSFRRYRLVKPVARRLLNSLTLIAAQTEEFAVRFRLLGADPSLVVVTGSIKYDGLETDRNNPRTQLLRRLFALRADELVWVAGSTSAPEEAMVLTVYQELRAAGYWLRLILVPRHPERFDEVVHMVEQRGLPCVRRSELSLPAAICPRADAVIVVDTLGELAHVWGLADVGFVGGSFAPRGGQSMLEPAAYGVPTFFGPCVWNYRDAARALVEMGAARQVHSVAEMHQLMRTLLADAQLRSEMGARACRYIATHTGAVQRTVQRLIELLASRRGSAHDLPRSQAA